MRGLAVLCAAALLLAALAGCEIAAMTIASGAALGLAQIDPALRPPPPPK